MRIKPSQKQSKMKLIVVLLALALVILAGWLGYAHHFQTWPFLPPPTKAEQNEAANRSETTNPQSKDASQTSSPNVDNSKTTDKIPTAPTMSVVITDLRQENGMVTYTGTVDSPSGGATGTCSAAFTNATDRPVTRTTQTSSTSCGPVSIPEQEFSALGTWTLTLRYYTNDTQAVTTKTIEIK